MWTPCPTGPLTPVSAAPVMEKRLLMSAVVPVDLSAFPEKTQQTLARVQDMFGSQPIPAPFLAMAAVEPFLKDFYMNFKKFVYSPGALDVRHKAIVGMSVAIWGKSPVWKAYFADRCREQGLSDEQLTELAAIVATNSTYNTFFKFRSLSGTDRFDGLPVGLRAHTFSGTSFDDQTVEIINTVISDLNACQPCVAGHVTKAKMLGIPDERLLEAIQCAAVIYSGIQFLSAVE